MNEWPAATDGQAFFIGWNTPQNASYYKQSNEDCETFEAVSIKITAL